MFRYLVAHVPNFRLDRCGWSTDQAAILVAEKKNALRVQAATPAAHQAGIRQGMSVSEARSRYPQVETELLDETAESEDLQSLSSQLLRISPNISALPPDAVVAEISRVGPGSAGQERALVERVRIRMKQLGHVAHVVVADNPIIALRVAQWKQQSTIVPKGMDAQAIGPLPLQALSLPARDQSLLHSLGIHTIAQFTQLPSAEINGRFSPNVIAAHALSCGRARPAHITPWMKSGEPCITQDLPAPVTELEALFFVIGAMVRDLTARLIAHSQAMTQASITFKLDGGQHQSITLRLGSPSRHAPTILDRMRHRLEQLQLGGPVVGLTLSTTQPTDFDGHQIDLQDPRRRDEAIEAISAQLQDALGSRSVLGARTTPRHRPEGAWRPVPFGIPVHCNSSSAAMAQARLHRADPVDAWEGQPDIMSPERPPILLNPPSLVEVKSEPKSPLNEVNLDGKWRQIIDLMGPEQISGEWWVSPFQRTYWRATLDDGRVAWLYREQDRWLLHGWWDR